MTAAVVASTTTTTSMNVVGVTSMVSQIFQSFFSMILSPPETYVDENQQCTISNYGGQYDFHTTHVSITMSGVPPAPVTWIYNTIDTICSNRYTHCSNWRDSVSFLTEKSSLLSSWFSEEYKIPDITGYKPTLLSFEQFHPPSGTDGTTSHTTNSIVSYLSAWWQYAFRTDSTALGELTTPTALLIVLLGVLPLLRFLKGKLLLPYFCYIGHTMALRTHGPAWIEMNQIRIQKFGEYIFRLMYHTAISCYGIYFFHNAPWWSSSDNNDNTDATIAVFRGYPHHSISPSMAWYYILQSAYNLDALLTLLEMSFVIQFRSIFVTASTTTKHTTTRRSSSSSSFSKFKSPIQCPITIGWSPNVRGDFQEMFIHHIVTNALVIGSSMLRLTRIGSMVFLIHDISGKCFGESFCCDVCRGS